MKKSKNLSRLQRRRRVLARGTKKIPRLAVFKSAKIIYANLIDDVNEVTLISVDSRQIKSKKYDKVVAEKVGELVAKKALNNKIKSVVFDRGGYKYHGKVRALAEGARKGGLKF